MRHSKLIKFLVWFVVITAVFAVAFSYMGIQISNAMIVALLGFGLLISGMLHMYNRGIFHQGHFPMLMGIVFILVGGVMFWGTLSFGYVDGDGVKQTKEQLWDLTPQETGIFILLIIVGVWSFISGARQALGASYFWGSVTKR